MLPSVRSCVLLLVLVMPTLGSSRSMVEDIQATDIAFVDALHGWVSVTEPAPAIFRTSDGGQTWLRIPISLNNGFYRISFFDQKTGVAIQFESEKTTAIYRTVDAGQTWTKVNTIDAQYGEHLVDLALTSPNDAFVVGEGEMGRGYVAQLSNGGRTLQVREDLPADFTQQSNALGVFGDGTGHLWIVGKELVLHSADGGKTWENQYVNTTPRIDMGISGTALPGGRAWIAAANFEIYKTVDYGKHWARALTTVDQGDINFRSISFFSSRQGCAVGNSSFIYCTNDGGVTWSKAKVFKTFLNGSPFNSKLLLFSSSRGWASVNGGLYKTEDGGHSFTEVLLTSSGPTEAGVSGVFQALRTSINGPTELAYDKNGFLYIVESMQGRLLRLDAKNTSTKVMLGEPENGFSKDYDYPEAVAADRRGNVFIADFNGRLGKLDTRSGEIQVLLPDGLLDAPASMTVDELGNLLIADRHHKYFGGNSGQRNLRPWPAPKSVDLVATEGWL